MSDETKKTAAKPEAGKLRGKPLPLRAGIRRMHRKYGKALEKLAQ